LQVRFILTTPQPNHPQLSSSQPNHPSAQNSLDKPPLADPPQEESTGGLPSAAIPGHVSLVGAGPGEPGAITLRALECLADADAVLYDYLVNPSLLRWATRPNVQLISLGRHGSDSETGPAPPTTADAAHSVGEPTTLSAINRRVMPQAEVSALLVSLAQAGRRVVRLKAGDPLIFARAAEEIAALQAAGIPFEVVPGITSALAAGSYAGIPLTHRDYASAVALVTGHPADTTPEPSEGDSLGLEAARPSFAPGPSALDWEALARFPGTLIVYMGTTQVEYWAGELLKHGKDPQTPVAILRRCGFSDQTVKRTTLDQLIATVTQPKRIRPPVVFLIGSAIDAPSTSEWFARRPLVQQTVLVTRPDDPQHTLARQFELLGAQVLHWPAIRILPVADPSALDQAIRDLPKFGWVVFNSLNGVRHFMERLWHLGLDARALHPCRIAAIGRQTAAELQRFHLRCDLVPEQFDADHLAEALVAQSLTAPPVHPDSDNGRPAATASAPRACLIVRASRGREVLAERLTAIEVPVTQVVAYQNVDNNSPPADIVAAMQNGRVDWVTVTSSAIADNLVRQFGAALGQTQLASISPITTRRLQQLGFTPTVEAKVYTTQGIVDAILAHLSDPT